MKNDMKNLLKEIFNFELDYIETKEEVFLYIIRKCFYNKFYLINKSKEEIINIGFKIYKEKDNIEILISKKNETHFSLKIQFIKNKINVIIYHSKNLKEIINYNSKIFNDKFSIKYNTEYKEIVTMKDRDLIFYNIKIDNIKYDIFKKSSFLGGIIEESVIYSGNMELTSKSFLWSNKDKKIFNIGYFNYEKEYYKKHVILFSEDQNISDFVLSYLSLTQKNIMDLNKEDLSLINLMGY